jgi:hypothetical protein
MLIYIDLNDIIRGGDWDNHAVCEVPEELLTELALSGSEHTRERALAELDYRGQL